MDRLPFPTRLAPLRRLMPRLVALMERACPGAYAFAFLDESRSLSATVHQNESVQDHTDRGMVLRLLAGGRNFETATNLLEEDHLIRLAEELAGKASKQAASSEAPFVPPGWADLRKTDFDPEIQAQWPPQASPDLEVHFSPLLEESDAPIGIESLLADARKIREEALAWDAAFTRENGMGAPLSFVMAQKRFKNTVQVFVDRRRNVSQILPVPVTTLMGQTAGGRSMRTLAGGLGGPAVSRLEAADFELALGIPHRLDRAERLTPGAYPVLTGPDVTGVIAHEAFGHTQEGDTVRQGRSIAPSLRGRAVGNSHATILSHGSLFQSGSMKFGTNATLFFDHEGQFCRKHALITAGVLGDPMTDLLSAQRLGLPRTGNGKRESWRRPTLVRQTNTYFTWGTDTFEGLVAKVKGTGYLARWSHGGMEDPKGANLTAGAEYLEEIRDGRLTGRLFVGPQGGHIELSGHVPELLSGILGKSGPQDDDAPDPENRLGGCGKYHKEYVSAGCGGPWILWNRMLCG